MRVLFVTQYFPPETGAAPARARHLVRALVRAGHEVRVVTGLPSHPAGVIPPQWRDKAGTRETFEGAALERVWLYATPNKTALRRLWNHLSFALSGLPVLLSGRPPDVVIATTPPLFHGLSAMIAARLRGAVFVNDCRDDWPHAAIALGEMRPGLVANVLDGIARAFQSRAARILVVTPGMQRQLASRGFEARRLVFLPNGADTELFRPRAGARPAAAGPLHANAAGGRAPAEHFQVLYAGTHGLVHGMEAIMDAAVLLRGEGVRFRFVGDGVAKAALQQRAQAEGLTNCVFEPSVAPEQLVALLHEADACIATTRGSSFAGETIPVKIFDYLAAGCPVVAAVCGDAASVVERSGGGLVVQPESGSAIAEGVRRLKSDAALRARLAESGPQFVEREHSRRAIGEKLVTTLAEAHTEAKGRGIAPRPTGLHGALKRLLDILLSALGLIVASPLMLLLAILIKLDSKGPALFRQSRIRQGSRWFTLLKFRSMAAGTPDLATHLVQPGVVRVTRIGAFIRRTSLDELPQLWNILSGDMTLVGPRPALYNQYDLIALRQQAGIDALQPGLTGWAQINGRDEIPMEQKVAYDAEYLERLSLGFDLEILVRTALTLFTMRGVR
jgi:lipopolysaccharide/colanic/teichoic acid biosynthesis glycosyltransferase/glycosyltransferase involved in cell wall biosynthesis